MPLIRFIKRWLSAALSGRDEMTAAGKAVGVLGSSEQDAAVPPPVVGIIGTASDKTEAQRALVEKPDAEVRRLIVEAEVVLKRQKVAPTAMSGGGPEPALPIAEDREMPHRVPCNFKQVSPKEFLELAGIGYEVQPLGTRFIGLRVGLWDYYVCCREFTGDQAAVLGRWYEAGALRLGWPGDFEEMPECLAGIAPRTVVVEAWRVIESINSKITGYVPEFVSETLGPSCDACGAQYAARDWFGRLLCPQCLNEELENDHTTP